MIQAEQSSLSAHKHIRAYMGIQQTISEDDLTAVLRLSQHLRVFGLLSAVGYANSSNNQNGQVRQQTVPVWMSLLGQLINEDQPPVGRALMDEVLKLAEYHPAQYTAVWRQSLVLANHWNFWARAYKE
jgi:hypothetical protein